MVYTWARWSYDCVSGVHPWVHRIVVRWKMLRIIHYYYFRIWAYKDRKIKSLFSNYLKLWVESYVRERQKDESIDKECLTWAGWGGREGHDLCGKWAECWKTWCVLVCMYMWAHATVQERVLWVKILKAKWASFTKIRKPDCAFCLWKLLGSLIWLVIESVRPCGRGRILAKHTLKCLLWDAMGWMMDYRWWAPFKDLN